MTRHIGRYEIIAELGRGGFGHVYRGLDPTVGRPVAIKVLTAAGEEGVLTRFRGEATASGRLRHPNIITVYDFGEQDGVPFIVMELLEGHDLQNVIESRKLPPLLHQIQIMAQIAAGLRHAHAAGIIHRDVKPANVMLLLDGNVKIMDFGIALITQSTHSRLTPRGAMIGTFRYMAPEQFRGVEPDARSDIFAYGLIFYELLSGVHPFHAPDAAAQMYNILSLDPVPIGEICPQCPPEIQSVVARLLLKDPELRYQTFDDVLFDIEPQLIELRQTRAGELLEDARAAKARNQLDAAQALIRQVLELAPAYEGARDFREQLQHELRRQAVRPKVEDLLRRGREALAAGKASEAVERLESAVRLDPTASDVKDLLQEARSRAEKLREAVRLVSEATSALARSDPAEALRLAERALEVIPGEPHALKIREESEAAVAREQRKARLADALTQARRLLQIHSWQEAGMLLNQINAEFPGVAAIADLSKELRAGREKEEREQALAAGLASVRQDIQQTNLQNALAKLKGLVARYPESSEAEGMLRFVQTELETQNRGNLINRSIDEARAAAATHDFSKAIRLLEGALMRYPADADLQRERRRFVAEQREAARREAVDQAIAAATEMRSQGRLQDALQALEVFLAAQGADAAVSDLKDAIAKQWEAERRKAELQDFIRRANQLMERGNLQETVTLLLQSPEHLRDNSQVTRLLEAAQLQLQQQAERKAALEQTLAEVRQLHEKGLFEPALKAIEGFRGRYGEDAQAEALKEQIQESEREARRAFDELVAQANALLSSDPAKAAALLKAASPQVRKRPEIQELKTAAAEAIKAKAARDVVEKIAIQAQELRERGDFTGALAMLEGGLKQFPGQPSVQRAREETLAIRDQRERALKEKARNAEQEAQRAFDELTAQVTVLVNTEPAKAVDLLDTAPLELRKHPEIQKLQQAAAKALKEESAGDAAEKIIAEARKLRERADFIGALAAIDDGLKQFADQPLLVAARQETVAARDQHEQVEKHAAADVIMQATALLETDPERAVALLKAAPEQIRRRSEIEKLERRAGEALQEKIARDAAEEIAAREKRQQVEQKAAADLVAQASALLETDPERAVALLKAAPEQVRKRPEIQKLEQAAAEALKEKVAREAIEKLAKRVRELCAHGDFAEALAAAEAGLKQFPRQASLVAARDETIAARELHRREVEEREIQAGLSRAKELLKARPDEAVGVLEELKTRYTDRPDVLSALAKAREQAREQARVQMEETERAQAAEAVQAASLLQPRDPQEALRRLQGLVPALRARPEVAQAIDECRAAIAAAERQDAVAEIESLITMGKIAKARRAHSKAIQRFGGDSAFEELLARMDTPVDNKTEAPPPQPTETPVSARATRTPVWAIAAAAAVVLIGAGAWIFTHRTPIALVSLVPVEIRTDPQGASVEFGERSCVTPNCRFQLAPGVYNVRARLEGYEDAQQAVTLEAGKAAASPELTLRPIAPPPVAGRATGTLVVNAGAPNALVFVDNAPFGRTDTDGRFSSPVAAAVHAIRVEKTGFETARERRVTIAENRSQSVTFSLVPQSAKLELRGAPAGVEVRANGNVIGQTDGSGLFSAVVPTGTQNLRLTQGSGTRDLPQTIAPGQTITLEWANVAPAAPAPSPVPTALPRIDPVEQAWEAARVSSDPAQVEAFLRQFGNGPHAAEAQARLETLIWARINRGDAQSLQTYISRFPAGPHLREAQAALGELAWSGVDRREVASLQTFVQQFPGSPHQGEAQTLIDQLERVKQEQTKQGETKQTEAKGTQDAERARALLALDRFNAAFSSGAFSQQKQRELRAVWPSVPKTYLDAVTTPRTVLKLEALQAPAITGDRATFLCKLTTITAQPRPPQQVKVTLQNNGSEWIMLMVEMNR